MYRERIPAARVRRVMDQVEREATEWSRGPSVVIAETDEGLRAKTADLVRPLARRTKALVAGSEREALAVLSSHPAVVVWVCDDRALDLMRVADAALRRCPVACFVQREALCPENPPERLLQMTTLCAGSGDDLIAELPIVLQAALRSFENRVAGWARLEAGRRLAEHYPPELVAAERLDPPPLEPPRRLDLAEADGIRAALSFHRGVVSKAARSLGVDRSWLYELCRRHGIDIDRFRLAPPSRLRRRQ